MWIRKIEALCKRLVDLTWFEVYELSPRYKPSPTKLFISRPLAVCCPRKLIKTAVFHFSPVIITCNAKMHKISSKFRSNNNSRAHFMHSEKIPIKQFLIISDQRMHCRSSPPFLNDRLSEEIITMNKICLVRSCWLMATRGKKSRMSKNPSRR